MDPAVTEDLIKLSNCLADALACAKALQAENQTLQTKVASLTAENERLQAAAVPAPAEKAAGDSALDMNYARSVLQDMQDRQLIRPEYVPQLLEKIASSPNLILGLLEKTAGLVPAPMLSQGSATPVVPTAARPKPSR